MAPRTPSSRSPRKRPVLPAITDAAALFNPEHLPLPKIRRAWERQAQSPYDKEKGRKKVWKRFGDGPGVGKNGTTTIANNDEDGFTQSEDPTDAGMMKRMKIAGPSRVEKGMAATRQAHRATKWDRRRSVLPRKQKVVAQTDVEALHDLSESEPTAQQTDIAILQPETTDEGAQEDTEVLHTTDEPDSHGKSPLVGEEVCTAGDEETSAAAAITDITKLGTVELPQTLQAPVLFNFTKPSSPVAVGKRRRTLSPKKRSTRTSMTTARRRTVLNPADLDEPVEQVGDVVTHVPVEKIMKQARTLRRSIKDELRMIQDGKENAAETATTKTTDEGPESTNAEVAEAPATLMGDQEPTALLQPSPGSLADVPYNLDNSDDPAEAEQGKDVLDASSAALVQDVESPVQRLGDEAEELDSHVRPDVGIPDDNEKEEEDDHDTSLVSAEPDQATDIMDSFVEQQAASAQLLADVEPNSEHIEELEPMETTSNMGDVDDQVEVEGDEDSLSEESESSLIGDETDRLTIGALREDTLTAAHFQSDLQEVTSEEVEPETAEADIQAIAIDDASPNEEFTSHLDYDTALLKDFLTRTAASKAAKVTSIARRSSLQNRRDSDAVRHALASSSVLEEKDVNSPAKTALSSSLKSSLSSGRNLFADVDLDKPVAKSQSTIEKPREEAAPAPERRRSSRAKTSKLPAPSSALPVPAKISVRSVNGTEVVELQRDEVAERGALVRANTKRNKMGATPAPKRMRKLLLDQDALLSTEEGRAEMQSHLDWERVLSSGQKGVRWREQLTEFQEFVAGDSSDPDAVAGSEASEMLRSVRRRSGVLPELEPRISPPLEQNGAAAGEQAVVEAESKKPSSRVRRTRGLGSVNGTPAKALLTPTEQPTGVENEQKPVVKERKSRLAMPKKVVLGASSSAIPKPKSAEHSGKLDTTLSTSSMARAREPQAVAAINEPEPRLLSSDNLLSPRKRPRSAFATSTTSVPVTSTDTEDPVPALMLSPRRAQSPRKKALSASASAAIFPSALSNSTSDSHLSKEAKEERRLLSPKRLVSPRKKLFAASVDGPLGASLGSSVSSLNFGGSLGSSANGMAGLMSPARRPMSPRKRVAGPSGLGRRVKR